MKYISFITTIIILASVSLLWYTRNNKALNDASKYVSNISLEHYTFRGVSFQKSDSHANHLSKNDILFYENPKLALVNYESMLKLDPGNVGLHLRLGLLYLKMEQISAAKEHLFFVHGNLDSALQPDSSWFLALANILGNNETEAKKYLFECIDKKCSYKKEASQLAELL